MSESIRVAYLTNLYPHVRHTFIRREIVALEKQGVEVFRFSIRDSGHDCVDPGDIAEKPKTESLLKGKGPLLSSMIKMAVTRPLKFIQALRTTLRLGSNARAQVKHLAYLAEACRLVFRLEELQIKHLHVHFATNPAAVAMLNRILSGIEYSITIHGPEEWDRPENLSLSEKYANAAFIVAVTDFGRAQVYRWTPLDSWSKTHVVRCGLDERFLDAAIQPIFETKQLVLVAGLTEQKAHLLVVEALHLVHQKGLDFQMIFVGDGHLRKLIQKRIDDLGLASKIHILGWQSNDQVREHLIQSRAMIMPSLAENLPVAMMEALVMARPVVGTYIAGVPELLVDGQTGWIVPAGNIERTAEAIESVLNTPVERLNEMGQFGSKRVRIMHNAMVEAGKMKSLFESQLAKSRV
jgi:colanic acid/amylovoran biosynthesis glycosyltransferase